MLDSYLCNGTKRECFVHTQPAKPQTSLCFLHSLTTSFCYLHMTREDTKKSTGSKRRPQLDKTNSQFGLSLPYQQMSCNMIKLTKRHLCLTETQIRLGSCPIWSESLLGIWRVAKDLSWLHADIKDSDQTGWCPDWPESLLGAHATSLVLLNCSSVLAFIAICCTRLC